MSEVAKKTIGEFRDYYHGYRQSCRAVVMRELAVARTLTDEPVVGVDFGLLFGIRLRADAIAQSLTILPETPGDAAVLALSQNATWLDQRAPAYGGQGIESGW